MIAQSEKMLDGNCSVDNRTSVTPTADVKDLTGYYQTELLKLKERKLANQEESARLGKERAELVSKREKLAKDRKEPQTEVVVKIDAPRQMTTKLGIVYYVSGAGWYPTYDIRSAGIGKPIQVSYKANIHQKTDEDWRNINVSLLSSDPSTGSVVPVLRTWRLGYGIKPPTYRTDGSSYDAQVYGRVSDRNGRPIEGATVSVIGSGVRTTTDSEGNYSILLSGDNKSIRFTAVGYDSYTRSASAGSRVDVSLSKPQPVRNEARLMGSARAKMSRSDDMVIENDEVAEMEMEDVFIIEEEVDKVVSTKGTRTAMGYQFDIEKPLTITSDGKAKTTEIGRFELPSSYTLASAPKVDNDAFVMAKATEWDGHNMLSGEATVYFEGSYIGKTLIDPSKAADTLSFSLGRDKQIVIKREKVSDNKKKRVIGFTQEKTIEWRTTVRNTHKYATDIDLTDQVPVSTDKDIKVEVEELTGGNLNAQTGIVTWRLNLAAGESRSLTMRYTVKYSKNRNLILE